MHQLIIIGEAAARLSSSFRRQHAEIEWSDVVGFRNFVVHEYFAVSWPIVWITAVQDVPQLRAQIVRVLTEEYGGPSSARD